VVMQVFKKELYNDIPNVAVLRVLRKRLHLKAYKLFIVQGTRLSLSWFAFKCKRFLNTRHTVTFGVPL
jgi:hypothetical protein